MANVGVEQQNEYKERLVAAVKKDVKQVMEEAVTRKFIHEESSSVLSLCASVEACLNQGLRRRALGLFKTSSTTALLHKIAKHCPEADFTSRKIQEIENSDPNRGSSSSGESVTKPPQLNNAKKLLSSNVSQQPRHLWIRHALFDKKLVKIVDYIVTHAIRYYERDALVADPDYGSILSSLLVGPCALEYTRTKTPDHFWTDPPADELIQRHKISSGHSTPPSMQKTILNYKRSLNTSSDDGHIKNRGNTTHVAKDYVESLHQNNKTTLLYGKNNVTVCLKDQEEPLAGYLSLHQSPQSLLIKWTPNQLMNGFNDVEVQDKSIYWQYALNVDVNDIVYVHCHQTVDVGGTIILVGQDGVQRPPIQFPKGGHLLAFLSCLETGLLPHGRLEPPLWSSQHSKQTLSHQKMMRRHQIMASPEVTSPVTPESIDYVFRVVNQENDELHKYVVEQQFDVQKVDKVAGQHRMPIGSSSTSSDSSSIDRQNSAASISPGVCANSLLIAQKKQDASIQMVCTTMKRQIISRAFYGWLAYCRHLRTVRTHLSGLVNTTIIPGDDAEDGLTVAKWQQLNCDGVVDDASEVYRLTYYGGVAHEIRKEVWPYLLGHYKFGSTSNERAELNEQSRQSYETIMSEWLAVEAIVRQRDKESTQQAIAKLSSESASGDDKKVAAVADDGQDLTNDVFEDQSSSDSLTSSSSSSSSSSSLNDNLDDDTSNKEITSTNQEIDPDKDVVDEVPETSSSHINNEILDVVSEDEINEEKHDRTKSTDMDVDEDVGDDDDRRGSEDGSVWHQVVITNASMDIHCSGGQEIDVDVNRLGCVTEENNLDADLSCVSPASSNGGVYSPELLETFGLNLHRIDKDVLRCDRNYWYFANENLEKLRNVMCTYVWEHLDIGYMQGMCDLVAPLLVILDDESVAYACFCNLMERMIDNFPNGTAMDTHLANMRSLIQIIDAEMYELMLNAYGDYTHLYFCYRWFLLDFKRELVYADVYRVWETIWAAKHVASPHFVLFFALSLLETYRDIILTNTMDFTDIIKFFNEMAEHHDSKAVLKLARDLVLQLQTLMENK